MLPVYAGSNEEALAEFNSRMGENGLERWRYHVMSVREIAESQIRLTLPQHKQYVYFLSPDDRQDFFADREARRLVYA